MNETFWDRIQFLLDKKGMTAVALSQSVGLSQGATTNYKNGGFPKADIAVKIAQLLGVSVEYLVTGTDSKVQEINTIPADLEAIVDKIESLDGKKRKFLIDSINHQLLFIDSIS